MYKTIVYLNIIIIISIFIILFDVYTSVFPDIVLISNCLRNVGTNGGSCSFYSIKQTIIVESVFFLKKPVIVDPPITIRVYRPSKKSVDRIILTIIVRGMQEMSVYMIVAIFYGNDAVESAALRRIP